MDTDLEAGVLEFPVKDRYRLHLVDSSPIIEPWLRQVWRWVLQHRSEIGWASFRPNAIFAADYVMLHNSLNSSWVLYGVKNSELLHELRRWTGENPPEIPEVRTLLVSTVEAALVANSAAALEADKEYTKIVPVVDDDADEEWWLRTYVGYSPRTYLRPDELLCPASRP